MKAWMTVVAAAAVASTLATGAAFAGDVSWTVTVGSPRPAPRVIYVPPPVIYQPPVVYQPAPVVYQRPPVVYLPAPVVYQPAYPQVVYAQPVQYVQRIPPGHLKKWHKHAYKYGYHDGYRHGRHDD